MRNSEDTSSDRGRRTALETDRDHWTEGGASAVEPCAAFRGPLDAWLELDDDARAAVRAHAQTCARCAGALAGMEAVEQVLASGRAAYASLAPQASFRDLLARQQASRPGRLPLGAGWRVHWMPSAKWASALAAAVLTIGLSVARWRTPEPAAARPEVDRVTRSAPTAAPVSTLPLTSSLRVVGQQLRAQRIESPAAPTGDWRPSMPSSPRRPAVLPRPGALSSSGQGR